jgi:uncharacterized membrane protein YqgA involved in biofilm formation
MRGTLLNTATVGGGALVGLALRHVIPSGWQEVAMSGIGLVVIALGVRMFLPSRNILGVTIAMAVGGILGTIFGLQTGLVAVSEWAKATLGGTGRFSEAVVTTSVLFCVGPMTLLGCLEDGLEGKTDLLKIKSTLDGVGAVFFAATLGPGVLVTAAIVLVVQGALTLSARSLRSFAQDEVLVAEATAVGGIMMIATALGLLGIKSLPVANYLPALALAPAITATGRRWGKARP